MNAETKIINAVLVISLIPFIILFLKGDKIKNLLITSTGFIISSLNTLVEKLSDELQLYRIYGEPKIFSTPIQLFFAWLFLTFMFIKIWETIKIRPKIFRIIYIVFAILIGWTMDFLGWKMGILKLGPKGNPIINAGVWILLVPSSIIIWEKIFSKLKHK
jgi:hypothetical protein